MHCCSHHRVAPSDCPGAVWCPNPGLGEDHPKELWLSSQKHVPELLSALFFFFAVGSFIVQVSTQKTDITITHFYLYPDILQRGKIHKFFSGTNEFPSLNVVPR